jgi:outer membrane biosynthesis protein TonB
VRVSRFEGNRLALALALSLAAHFLVWGGYEVGKNSGLWQRLHWPKWLQHVAKIKPPAQPVAQPAEPEIFLDVSQPSTEAPQNAKYYSDKNSRAANPDPDRDSDLAKLNGKQTDVPKTQSAPRSKPVKAQSPPATPPTKPSPQEAQSKPTEPPGNMTLAKSDPAPNPNQLQPERPRTLKEARAQQAQSSPALEMQQDGGTHRRALVPSLDARATPFGAYDAKFIAAVSQRWYDLLDSQQFAQDRSGKVTLRFHINYDGSITDVQQLQNTVGDLLGYVCQKAVTDPAPFEAWPSDMRRMVGANFREITFTFYYY